ncbi:MAG TPA: DUF4834 domain-containing protein [Flavobacterium sp.]
MLETASLWGVIKIIFYFLLFYYIFKFAMRLLLPMLLKKAVEKAEENLRRHEDNARGNSATYKSPPNERPRETKQVGEYVDFEEID